MCFKIQQTELNLLKIEFLEVPYINERLSRKGKVWDKAYHDHALRKDEDVKRVARYIVANPLRKRLVDKIVDYPLWDAVWI